MAQRTGAERFLASPAKTASARAALALAVAALGLAGCGGSSNPEAASTASTSAASAAGSPDSSDSPGPSGSAGGSKDSGKAKKEDSSSATNASSGGGKKHGPYIAQPKGEREREPTPADIASATVADMTLESPAVLSAEGGPGSLAATYTCDGADSWPALRWAGVPAGTEELALYVMNAQPVGGRLFFDWAVAGLDPGLESIEAGQLPRGAVVGINSFGKRGYSICPPAGSGEIYIFALFALPRSLSPKQGFDPRALREEILDVSGNVGLLTAVYGRG